MRYQNVSAGVFVRRLNRFTATVEINGIPQTAHVKNTGRLRELLLPGAKVFLQQADKAERKTVFDLIAAEKDGRIVNIDSQIPNAVAAEWVRNGGLFPDLTLLRREVTYGNSRFDLYAEHGGKRAFIEVKGVTLLRGTTALFPDAPTERGIKHIKELCACVNDGYEAYLLFVIQFAGAAAFAPNAETHPAFAEALKEALSSGVRLLAYDCAVTPDSIFLRAPVPICIQYAPTNA